MPKAEIGLGQSPVPVLESLPHARTKSPGRVKAMYNRWKNQDPKWANWRETTLARFRQPKTSEHRAHISQSNMGRSGTNAGEVFPVGRNLRIAEKKRDGPLTEIQIKERTLAVGSRQIIKYCNERYGDPKVNDILLEHGVKAYKADSLDVRCLVACRAAELCLTRNPFSDNEQKIEMTEIIEIYKQLDPRVFERQRRRLPILMEKSGSLFLFKVSEMYMSESEKIAKHVRRVLDDLKKPS